MCVCVSEWVPRQDDQPFSVKAHQRLFTGASTPHSGAQQYQANRRGPGQTLCGLVATAGTCECEGGTCEGEKQGHASVKVGHARGRSTICRSSYTAPSQNASDSCHAS